MLIKNKSVWYYIDLFISGLFLYLLDRIIKIGFLKSPDAFGDFVHWLPFGKDFYTNQGIFFGLIMPLGVIIIISVIILAIVIYYLILAINKADFYQIIAWGLICIGGLSNLYDRIVYNFVIDWWIMPWQAIINLADIYIATGILLLFFIFKKYN